MWSFACMHMVCCNTGMRSLSCFPNQDLNTQAGNCADGDMRLIKDGEVSLFEGRVEVCLNNAWGTVCNNFFDQLEVKILCDYFNFPEDGGEIGIIILNRDL